MVQNLPAPIAAAANQPAPVAILAPAAFVKTPWATTSEDPIDFNVPGNRKMFLAATAPIVPKFTGAQQELRMFLQAISVQGRLHGWSHLLFGLACRQLCSTC